jgi:cobaltochelatase CobS
MALQREYVTLNCSQYTSPLEILGGQSVEGFKEGKLIDCWQNGKILILDEMPKLDANTAGLFNDALAKSSKTRPSDKSKINSANPEQPPIPRSDNFAVIATGNIYPNEPPAPQYRGNNQQDLSLLDRFSGSVYYTEFDNNTDQDTTRFKFLYDFLVGNYYEYIDAKKKNQALPAPRGLRTVIESLNLKNLALVSYRTNIAFRVGFEFELVRAIAKMDGQEVEERGKTLLKTFKSYMVAFKEGSDAYNNIIRTTKYTEDYIRNMANTAIREITKDKDGFLNSLNPLVKSSASDVFKRYQDFYVANPVITQ